MPRTGWANGPSGARRKASSRVSPWRRLASRRQAAIPRRAAYHGRVPRTPNGSPPLDEPLSPTPATDPPSTGGTSAAPPPPGPDAPGLGEQIGATRDSVKRVVDAHVELAKAEFADIADAAKRAAALIGIAVGAGIVAGLIVIVGMPLFLGEAIFGSMGWGILLGLLLPVALALTAVVGALRPGIQASIGRAFLGGLLVAIVVGVVLGLDLSNRVWSTFADTVLPGSDPAWRPLLVAVLGLVVVGAVLGLLAAVVRGAGGGGLVGALVGGAFAGLLLGLLTAFAPGHRVGAAIGVAAGLVTWIALLFAGIARGGFDTDALKDRFWPAKTIEATKETIEWARERMPLLRRS